MSTVDIDLIKDLVEEYKNLEAELNKKDIKPIFHPADKIIFEKLCKISDALSPGNQIYQFVDELNDIWAKLIEHSIICLRFYDKREPFIENPKKKPSAYGIEDLKNYFEKYSAFEAVLYGSSTYYRDHIIHVFRTWLIGMNLLFKDIDGMRYGELIAQNIFDDERLLEDNTIEFLEIVSMWTMISLTHDLGYPLEKAQKIYESTAKMMRNFLSHYSYFLDLSFNRTQDHINEYIVKMISSRMRCSNNRYTGRIQPKYYIKFSKSLESFSHGIVSAIILYKTLIYFLESDYNLNEDYWFDKNDVKQFYIRREILRAIATHTCHDIYLMHANNLSFLLVLCDDLQEWDRKTFYELYKNQIAIDRDYEIRTFTCNKIEIYENIKLQDHNTDKIKWILQSIVSKFEKYKKIFRDGIDTKNRSFDYINSYAISIRKNRKLKIIISIEKDKEASLNANIEKWTKTGRNEIENLLKKLGFNINGA